MKEVFIYEISVFIYCNFRISFGFSQEKKTNCRGSLWTMSVQNERKKGCDLAIRIDGKSYFVEGTKIDDHGDAHANDGFVTL